jgi:hypothetical protein
MNSAYFVNENKLIGKELDGGNRAHTAEYILEGGTCGASIRQNIADLSRRTNAERREPMEKRAAHF